jgi:hypothetical protein
VGSTACDVRERRLRRLTEEEKGGDIYCRVQVTCRLGGYPAMPEMPRTLTAALHREEEDWFIAHCLKVAD